MRVIPADSFLQVEQRKHVRFLFVRHNIDTYEYCLVEVSTLFREWIMGTFFASAEKADKTKFAFEVDLLSNNPVISALLNSISGLLAVLNEHRQIVTVNDIFLQTLGYDNLLQVLELRPGDALHCLHAGGEPAGCGTTKYCETCGAAIAIVSSLEQNQPVERLCALSVSRNGQPVELALLVRSHPVTLDNVRFLLLFIQDVTLHERRAALERTFFHDINNMLYMLVSASELLAQENPSSLAQSVHEVSTRLVKEVAIQRTLMQNELSSYQPVWHTYHVRRILGDLHSFFARHPAACGKSIDVINRFPDASLKTEISLLSRVLCNMIINALEATAEGGTIKIWYECESGTSSFHVWNDQEIPPAMALRLFQRNFSTKGQNGRGIGTYSMKLFGEGILGGEVSFQTSVETGTVFKLSLPVV